jgi:hypothetical protein
MCALCATIVAAGEDVVIDGSLSSLCGDYLLYRRSAVKLYGFRSR